MPNKPNNSTRNFDGELNTDIKDYHSKSNAWSFCRNGINNSSVGDVGSLGNEPATRPCLVPPNVIIGSVIGTIYMFADTWVIFSTDDITSEIGIFNEALCQYTALANNPCLNFRRSNIITGASKKNHDCSYHLYWQDGRNPDRTMTTDPAAIPYQQTCFDAAGNQITPTSIVPDGCITCTNNLPLVLDCDRIRLSRLVQSPCIEVSKGASGGNLLNGSYFATIAYMIDGQRVTSYFTPSIPQALFDHKNVAGSIDIDISNLDQRFDEYELVVVSVINAQTQAKRIGVYNTRQSHVSIDNIDNKLVDVPLEWIPLNIPIAEKSDAMYEVGNYLLRVGPTDKFDFNYQPFANQIRALWQSVEYPADYYVKGGNQTSYLRDEVYPFFIQWVYTDGELSSAYHIPGRAPVAFTIPGSVPALILNEDAALGGSGDSIDVTDRVFEVFNTASVLGPVNVVAPDGVGFILSEGEMGYWESTEKYPDDKTEVYNATWTNPATGQPYGGTTNTQYDLCGFHIRHHKFPEQSVSTGSYQPLEHYANTPTVGNPTVTTGMVIRIMGVRFENIKPPTDNDGNIITNIVGYRILRGSREGNKSIIAKGMINNLFKYDINGVLGNLPNQRTGLYPNYPYNDLGPDRFISTNSPVSGGFFSEAPSPINPNDPFAGVTNADLFTFHSPETQFRNPFLSMKELKVYGTLIGKTDGGFVEPNKHPQHKLLTNLSFTVSIIAGIGAAVLAMQGEKTTTRMLPRKIDLGGIGLGASNFLMPGLLGPAAQLLVDAAVAITEGINIANQAVGGSAAFSFLGANSNVLYAALGLDPAVIAASLSPATLGYSEEITQKEGAYNNIPLPLRIAQAIPTFMYYMSEGSDAVLRLIESVLKYRQYALQYQSHCLYTTWASNVNAGQHRRLIGDMIYLDNQIQDFGANFRINNLYRGRSVALQTTTFLDNPTGDNSRVTVGSEGLWTTPFSPIQTDATSFYAALKNRIRNQYGQIGGVQQVPTGCVMASLSGNNINQSPTIFGGDTYVTRYTEKNTMFFFYDWLYDQPDGTEYNYYQKQMIPYPTYWMDTRRISIPEFLGSVVSSITASILPLPPSLSINPSLWDTPAHARFLDRAGPSAIFQFEEKEAYMYLFNSGVRDFFVESEINTDLRDWGDNQDERHYDANRAYTDLPSLFDSKIIKAGNFFKYDYSLSVSKLYPNFTSWANIQPINYDPYLYASCFVHYPTQVIYSLPQQDELIKDNWQVFLPNNYKRFKSRVTAIKPINKSGAIIFFETDSPVQFVGSDILTSGAGTKITIGDGGLFTAPMQSLLNADTPYEYGACQNRTSVINTPMGLFWIGQSQGKIFQLTNGIQEISMTDLKWWFAQYLPYKLIEQFPDFALTDNPVIGICCQSIYDSENGMVYFTKRDFQVKSDLPANMTLVYVPNRTTGNFEDDFNLMVNGIATLPIKLGDPDYFEDCSFTVSYDPKVRNWISWHDWHPEMLMPGKNTFMSTKTDANGNGSIWVHNELVNLYCNYYGVSYAFEIEFMVNTVQQVNTLRSVEIQTEFYRYAANEHDRYLFLDEFFDQAVVFNNEQVSGMLNLNLMPKNNPMRTLDFPRINLTSIDILYSRVENKYRFNQFNDITDDRGEYTSARRMIWNTANNGYVKTLNPINLDYQKNPMQKKKLRGYTNSVWLSKAVSGATKILMMFGNTKNLNSPR